MRRQLEISFRCRQIQGEFGSLRSGFVPHGFDDIADYLPIILSQLFAFSNHAFDQNINAVLGSLVGLQLNPGFVDLRVQNLRSASNFRVIRFRRRFHVR